MFVFRLRKLFQFHRSGMAEKNHGHGQGQRKPTKSNEEWNDDYNFLQGRLMSVEEALKQKEKELQSHKNKIKSLGKQLHEVTQERNDLTKRLSEEMSTKLGMNETSIENISIKNRPMKVAEEYEVLCAHSWLSAKDALDTGFKGTDETMIGMLKDIMMEIQEIATVKYKEMTNTIYEMITVQADMGAAEGLDVSANPIMKLAEPEERRGSVDQVAMIEQAYESIPDGLKLSISDFLRGTCDTVDIKGLFQALCAKFKMMLQRLKDKPETSVTSEPLKRQESFHTLKETMVNAKKENYQDIETYIHDCARLAWKMAAQRPPMKFDDKTGVGEKWKGERHQHVYYSSQNPDNPQNVVKYYVFPALKHKDFVMKIGTVYVGPKSEEKPEKDKDETKEAEK